MSDSYTLAALRGLGMEGDNSYTSAALRGFGDESYTSAALRGCGSKLKKGSREAKVFMARLRAMRGTNSKGGKKLKGGIAFSTIASALSLIPTAIKGAHAIYKWIKGSGLLKGGRNVYRDPILRNAYIKREIEGKYTGLAKARKMPYKIGSAAAKRAYESRLKRIPKTVLDLLAYKPEEIDEIVADAGKMRDKIRAIQSNKPRRKVFSEEDDFDDIVYPPTESKKSHTSRRIKKRPRIRVTEEPISDIDDFDDIVYPTTTPKKSGDDFDDIVYPATPATETKKSRTSRRIKKRPRIRVIEEPISDIVYPPTSRKKRPTLKSLGLPVARI